MSIVSASVHSKVKGAAFLRRPSLHIRLFGNKNIPAGDCQVGCGNRVVNGI